MKSAPDMASWKNFFPHLARKFIHRLATRIHEVRTSVVILGQSCSRFVEFHHSVSSVMLAIFTARRNGDVFFASLLTHSPASQFIGKTVCSRERTEAYCFSRDRCGIG